MACKMSDKHTATMRLDDWAQQKADLVTQLLHLIHGRRAEDVGPDGQSLTKLDVCWP